MEMVLVVMVNIRRKPPLARKEWFATNAQYIMCIYIMKINIFHIYDCMSFFVGTHAIPSTSGPSY